VILVAQVKHCGKNGCALYVIQIYEEKEANIYPFANYLVLKKYSHVLPKEMGGLQSNLEIDLKISCFQEQHE